MTRQTLRQSGEATLTRLFGTAEQAPGLASLLTGPVFGGVWNRPGLAFEDRLLCTIAALATGPRMRSLRRYIGAGLDHGLDAAAVREILVRASLYAGFSAAEETLAALAESRAGAKGNHAEAGWARASLGHGRAGGQDRPARAG